MDQTLNDESEKYKADLRKLLHLDNYKIKANKNEMHELKK